SFMFLSMIPLPPKSTLFPYTTLFRSKHFYPGNPSFSHQRFQPGNMKCCRGKTDNSNRNGGHFYTLKKCIPMQPYDCADSDNFPKNFFLDFNNRSFQQPDKKSQRNKSNQQTIPDQFW